MTLEIVFVLLVALGALALFITEKLRVDVVALLVMVTFIATGILTPTQGIAGFSNPATVTVAAMFVLAAALQKTGALNFAADYIIRLSGESSWRAAALLMLAIAAISGFINNTAAVAVFLPVTMELARKTKTSPSKLLIPLSFASLFGGACTLIGTSTNILVSTLSVQHGDRPIGMFEMAPLGLILLAAGFIYLLTVGLRLLPDHPHLHGAETKLELGRYLTEVGLTTDCSYAGASLGTSPLTQNSEIEILEIQRNDQRMKPDEHLILESGDLLRIQCNLKTLNDLRAIPGLEIHPLRKCESEKDGSFLEAAVAPGSVLNGHTLKTFNFRERFKCTALAVRRHGQTLHTRLGNIRLKTGDVLLLSETPTGISRLRNSRDFVLISKVDLPLTRAHLALPSVIILGLMVAAVALELLPIVVAALLGCVAIVLAGSITPDEVYESIDWSVIMLLGGMLTLGAAIQESGADKILASSLLSIAGDFGPWFLLCALYLVTSLLTEALSNNATAVLLVPIAFSAAHGLGVEPRPFLMAIAFAASASFMTPMGYQTNTLVYGPGGYSVKDFMKVGTPLNLLFWVLASMLIPVFWPFQQLQA
jgi:di/tricarboxylate transporter